MSTATRIRPSLGRTIVAIFYALLTVNALKETFWSDSPPSLRALQAAVGVIAAATTWGAWSGARWSATLATIYGLVAGAMVVSLGPMLDMPVEERGGLWVGGAIILVFSLACAWFLRRATRVSVDLTDVI